MEVEFEQPSSTPADVEMSAEVATTALAEHSEPSAVPMETMDGPGETTAVEKTVEQASEPIPMDTADRPPDSVAGNIAAKETAAASSAAAPMETGTGAVEEDDDPVVQECDVYLNRMYDPPDFVGDLYLLQYPLRPMYRPYGDQGELDRVELKHKSRRLKLVYKLAHGDNYDEDSVTHEKHGQKHMLTSTVVANPSCSYAVCVVHQGRMTVTPIRAVNQLRPDFEAFDRVRAQQQKQASGDLAPEAGPDHLAAALAAADAPAAASSDSGPEDDNAGALMEAGEMVAGSVVRVEYAPAAVGATDMMQFGVKQPEDPWVRLDYYSPKSDEAKDIYEKHVVWSAAAAADAEEKGEEADHPKLQALALDGDKATFLARLCGQEAGLPKREKKAQDEPQDGLSSYVLSRMPVDRQVEAVVRHFGVVSYGKQLRKRLPPSTLRSHGNDEQLLQMLQNVAVLVTGNWVLKSQLAGFEGPEADARDMLLCLLVNKEGVLAEDELRKWEAHMRGVSTQARREIVSGIAVLDRSDNKWKLKNPHDEDFKKKFPKLVKEKRAWWDSYRVDLLRRIQGAKVSRPSSSSASQSSAARARSRLIDEIRAQLTLGAMQLSELRRTLQKKNATVAIHEQDVMQALQHKSCDAVQVRDLWMLAKTGNEDNDKFRSVLVGLFRQKDSVSKRDVLAEYERIHKKPCMLSDFLVRQLVREIAEKADKDNYVLKGTLLKSLQGSAAS